MEASPSATFLQSAGGGLTHRLDKHKRPSSQVPTPPSLLGKQSPRSVPGAPFNATVTITNLDNSHRVQCIASVAAPDPNGDAVLAPATFAEIADPTDAPVPVEITWANP